MHTNLGMAAVFPNLTDNFGVEAWVYPTDAAGGKMVVYNGNSGAGGAIYNVGTLALNQCTLSANSATGGYGGPAGKYGTGGNGGERARRRAL